MLALLIDEPWIMSSFFCYPSSRHNKYLLCLISLFNEAVTGVYMLVFIILENKASIYLYDNIRDLAIYKRGSRK